MRRLLIVLLLCLPAALPYFGGELPRSNDSLTHLYRAVELEQLIRSGILFPRWAPDLAIGYGYPLFNYFAYGSHYFIVLIHFTGLSLLWSLRLAYIMALMLSGLGAYLFARDLFGEQAGIIAALAYTYSPYLLYTAHVRGGLPESLALAFSPFALWALRRALNGGRRFIVPAALCTALIIFSHIGMALQQLPLLGVWGLFLIAAEPQKWLIKIVKLSVIFTLALGLTAFIWIPAITELPYVQFETAFANANLNYRNQFFYWFEIFSLPNLPVYTDLVNPPLVRTLPLVASVVALLAFIKVPLPKIPRFTFYFLIFLAFATSFLIIDLSKPLWDVISLLQRSAFPWRFLGPASLFIAVAASALSPQLLTFRQHFVMRSGHSSFAISVLIFISALPLLYVPREAVLDNPTLRDLARYEIPPLLVGTTTTGEYTPVAVKEFPEYKVNQEKLIRGERLEKLTIKDWQQELMTAQPYREVYRLSGAAAATATYRVFYFPGWQATLDSKPLEITPSDPYGLITFEIPAGAHTLEIWFGETPVRQVANVLSIVSAVLMIGLWTLDVKGWLLNLRAWLLGPGHWRDDLAAYLLLCFFATSLLMAPFLIQKRGAPPMPNPLGIDVAGELWLHGYDLRYEAANKVTLTLLWQAQHELGVNYGVTIRVVDDQGLQWQDDSAPEEARHWRFRPGTDQWQPDQFFYDSYVVKTIPGAPPQTYHVEVVVYRPEDRASIGKYRLGDFVIRQPTMMPLQMPLTETAGLRLIDLKGDRAETGVGFPYRLDMKWQVGTEKVTDAKMKVELVSAKGVVVWTKDEVLAPNYPLAQWPPGAVLMQSISLRLPAALESGDYHWRLQGRYDAPLKIRVTAPQRVFAEPKMMFPRRANVGEAITLLGYDVSQQADRLSLTLYWQAQQEMTQSYRVFVHVLDREGNLVAQSDGEPDNWARPTTGWLRGEIVRETRELRVPPGDFKLVVGVVDEAGERIGAFDLMK